MVAWLSSAEIAKDTYAFEKLIFTCFGCYIWEIGTTLSFEISLLTGRRRFRWPLGASNQCLQFLANYRCPPAFFFLSRYCMLFSFIGLIISLSVRHPINCGALFTFNSWTGNMAILGCSTSLMLRTFALWERKRSVVVPIGLLSLVHWGLLYRTMFVIHAVWDGSACIVASTNPTLLKCTFFYTMGFDFGEAVPLYEYDALIAVGIAVITCTTAVSLMSRHSERTDLWRLLFTDGLVYFVLTFSMNSIPAVLNLINLNATMNVIGTIPAATVSTIAACRAVMRLLDFNSDVYVHSLGALPTSNPRHSGGPFSLSSRPISRFTLSGSRPEGVLVTRQQITMTELEFQPPLPTLNKHSVERYEVEGEDQHGLSRRDASSPDGTFESCR
ncbi:hypothetical protein MIND_00709500 [Mycena indigotica]|uniref:Transmembrane protein n=1 Tax=Mycena indigotica TaxID=2126181 RepID=A0A8H6W1D8_9AGAR|nr:uncharacterized protein MIND_00709500 [Mycena indigotica]KAF7301442.1 hypothetical protein MIND_00709500 [Mycena indigotica]